MENYLRVYCYDSITREYTGIHDCQQSPLEPGNFLYPSFYSLIEPPLTKEYEIPFYTERDYWTIVPDYRNAILYNKETGAQDLKITQINQEIPSTHTLKKKESFEIYIRWNEEVQDWIEDPELKKEFIRQQQLNKISYDFYTNLGNGFFTSQVLGISVDCRRDGQKNDLQNVQALISLLQLSSTGTTVTYYGHDQNAQNVTVEMLQTLVIEMQQYGITLYQAKWALEDQIKNASTIEDIEKINWVTI